MTDAQLIKWAENRGLTNVNISNIKRLIKLVDRYGKQGEHCCNGDRHYLNPNPNDKNKNCELWENDADRTMSAIKECAKNIGFDNIDWGVGPYPVFAKGTDTCIHLPE